MKKAAIITGTMVLLLSLTACSSQPSDTEIKEALDEGIITVEDAKAKGWIDDAWIEAHFEQVDAKSKIYLFAPFETTYLDGTPAASDIIHDTMCLVFFDTSKEETMDKLVPFQEAQKEMEAAGVPMLGIVTDEDLDAARERLKDVNFPVIVYNDEMQAAMADYQDIIDTDLTSVFTKDGGFYTAWYMQGQTDELVQTAKDMVATEIDKGENA